jgi:hypothetical protein
VWGYMAENGPVCVSLCVRRFEGRFGVWGFWGKKKVQKKGVFWGVQMGPPQPKSALTPSKQRKNLFFRVYRGFFLPGNRLRVVLRAKKIFFRGKPPNF